MQALHSEYIDPHKLLNLLPANELPHLRAVLLERLGRHQEALRYILPLIANDCSLLLLSQCPLLQPYSYKLVRCWLLQTPQLGQVVRFSCSMHQPLASYLIEYACRADITKQP